jgi:hypothetical protein
MVSAETLWNVAVSAAVSAMTLVTVDPEMATYLVKEVEEAALGRLEAEVELGRQALAAGGDPEEERLILTTWAEWYHQALETMEDLEVSGPSASTLSAIREAQEQVRHMMDRYEETQEVR